MFSFSDVPKFSAIAGRLWNNNIQFHSVIAQRFWQGQAESPYCSFLSGMCFLNGHSSNVSKVMAEGPLSLWGAHYHFFWFWGIATVGAHFRSFLIWLRKESNLSQKPVAQEIHEGSDKGLSKPSRQPNSLNQACVPLRMNRDTAIWVESKPAKFISKTWPLDKTFSVTDRVKCPANNISTSKA